MFVPGETITQEFHIPFANSELAKVIVTYKQDDRIILTKTVSSFGPETKISEAETKILILLSQKESLLFDGTKDYKIQLNVFTTRGSRAASKEVKGSTAIQHYEKVITNG